MNVCSIELFVYICSVIFKQAEIMSITSVTRKELKSLKILDFKENDLIDIIDNSGETKYTIHISYGDFKLPLKTTVTDSNYNYLNCTAGTKNGWPYYISNFIQSY